MCEAVFLLAELGFLARHHGDIDGKASTIHCRESRVDGKASSMR